MSRLVVNANFQWANPQTGLLTREAFLLVNSIVSAIQDATGEVVLLDAEQTITQKTIDGDTNTMQDIATGSLKSRTGTGNRVVTADAAGTSTGLAKWDADGDLGVYTEPEARTLLGLVIGTNVQAWDADLDSWSGVTRAAGFDTLVATPTSANLKALLSDETGSGAAVFGTAPTLDVPVLASYTVVLLPAAGTAGRLAYVSDEAGGAVVAFDDGVAWRRVTDRAVVS